MFAIMAELVSRCANLGELLEKAVRFYNLTSNDIPMRLDTAEGNAVLSFEMAQPAAGSRTLYDRVLAGDLAPISQLVYRPAHSPAGNALQL